jgi:hypothetical protein
MAFFELSRKFDGEIPISHRASRKNPTILGKGNEPEIRSIVSSRGPLKKKTLKPALFVMNKDGPNVTPRELQYAPSQVIEPTPFSMRASFARDDFAEGRKKTRELRLDVDSSKKHL